MTKDRVLWLDVAKGITILLMIIGHTSIPQFLSNFIFAFHMPLFFIASGWCTNLTKENYGCFVLKKLRTLGIPFFVYSIAVILIAKTFNYQEIGWKSVLANGWEGYALWFVPVLFFSLMMAKFIMSYINQTWLHYAICLLLILGGAFLRYQHIYLPWTLATVPYATCLVLMGKSLGKCKEYIDNPRLWIFGIGFILTSIISYKWRMDMAWNCITPVVLLTIGAVSGTIMMFTLSSYLTKIPWLSTIFMAIGKETFIIMAFSQVLGEFVLHFYPCNKVLEYVIMITFLLLFMLIKNGFNKLIGYKLL